MRNNRLAGCVIWLRNLVENRVLRRISGPRRDELTGEWRRLHNGELYALYASLNILRVIKLRRMRWAGHIARIWKNEVHTWVW